MQSLQQQRLSWSVITRSVRSSGLRFVNVCFLKESTSVDTLKIGGATAPSGRFLSFPQAKFNPFTPYSPYKPSHTKPSWPFCQDICYKIRCTFSTSNNLFYWDLSHDLAVCSIISRLDFYITRNTFSKIVQKIASR